MPIQTTATPFVQPSAASKIKYRCKADIIAEILETASAGEVPKSRIYYKSFLTYHRLRGYMTLLLENGLMEYLDHRNKRLYKATEKGIVFLRAYNGIRELID
jgi:predicted transcriptional regulator